MIKTALLPPSSRELSEAHLKLAMALEFDPTPGARERTVGEVELSKASLALRVEELEKKGGEGAEKEVQEIKELMEDLDMKVSPASTLLANSNPPRTSADCLSSVCDLPCLDRRLASSAGADDRSPLPARVDVRNGLDERDQHVQADHGGGAQGRQGARLERVSRQEEEEGGGQGRGGGQGQEAEGLARLSTHTPLLISLSSDT